MEIKKVLDFDAIKLSIASPEQILKWSHGEILKPETINYRTQRPEKDGLFCEKIFGPTKDWECYCGKYKKIRYKGIVCDRCGVEVTRQLVRRERMGHINLCTPVTHIWYLKGVPSSIGLVLGISTKELEKIAYFHSFIIIEVNDELKKESLKGIEDEFKARKQKIQKEAANSKEAEKEIKALEEMKTIAKDDLKSIAPFEVISDVKYRELSIKYGEVFKAGIGAEALKDILSRIDLNKLVKELKIEVINSIGQKRKKALKRLKLIEGLVNAKISPEWMIISQLPVIPPELRPMVQLDGGRFAASDLNDLYRRVINRNNRLKKLMNLDAPEIILRNEKRMLQEAVDALIDSSYKKERAGQMAAGQKRKLKSLTDMLKGKQGRFRQNLLGKRVDYSGRSVIVVGPELKLHQCGLPKMMALELFKPFVIGRLIKDEIAHNVKGASRMIEKEKPEVWDALDEVIKNKFVLLNRAPTLHRLGIQAFRPILIEGMAIQIHPLVCSAFNADFDGDQMAVHLPLSKMAQEEARTIMISKENILKPSSGEPIVNPTQDIVFGIYWLTKDKKEGLGEGKFFSSAKEAIIAYQVRNIELQTKIKVHLKKLGVIETTAGRIMFNRILPEGTEYINDIVTKRPLQKLVAGIFEKYGKEEIVRFVDDAKDLGFKYSTRSGLTISMDDFQIPESKKDIIEAAQERAKHMRQQFNQGLITEKERYIKMLNVWSEAKENIQKDMEKSMNSWRTMALLLESGARGDTTQFTQIAGMKGNVVNTRGDVIELPIKANYKEGLSALEYFITTHGARKALTDTALKTADAGYLTRRLVDVSQDVIIREDDCGDKEGIEIEIPKDDDTEEFEERIYGRVLARDATNSKGQVILKKSSILDKEAIQKLIGSKPDVIHIRNIVACKGKDGLCKKCYGFDLATSEMVKKGAAVGIIAAQSIGEPGTQLTMRTTHTGGVAGTADITQGLPRVEELFEARQPKGQAVLAEIDGIVDVKESDDMRTITLVSSNVEQDEYDVTGCLIEVKNGVLVQKGDILARKEGIKPLKAKSEGLIKISKDKTKLAVTKEALFKEYKVSRSLGVRVKNGDHVTVGQQLTDGSWNLQDALSLLGEKEVQKYLISEVRSIYTSQGVNISDKHIEIIVRQMFSRTRIEEPNDTLFIVGEIVSRSALEKENRRVKEKRGKEADSENLLLSITKVSLSTDSFLSAASFQETSRILIEASTKGKIDELKGLKENVIIGKLIPVGTGYTEK